MGRMPTALKLGAAAVIPFSLVAAVLTATHRYLRLSETPSSPIGRFADHISDVPRIGKALPAGKVIWSGSPGDEATWIRDVIPIRRELVLLNAERLIVIDRLSGTERASVPLSDSEANPSALSPASATNTFWVYSPVTGKFVERSIDAHLTPTGAVFMLDRFSGTPHWLGNKIVKNGLYAHELLRLYAPTPSATNDRAKASSSADPNTDVTPEPHRTVDGPLFRGLPRGFSRQLHDGTLAARPDGKKLALAFHWHDRLNFYDSASLHLERAISGPHLSKLEFSLVGGGTGGAARIRPNNDSVTAYVDLATTNDVVVALHSGRDERRFPGTSTLGDTLHVYAWDGRFFGIWRLNDAVSDIVVDESSRSLLALRRLPVSAVVRIDLTNLLTEVRATRNMTSD